MWRVVLAAARKGRRTGQREFSSVAVAAAASVARRGGYLLFPGAGLGVYAAVDDETKRFAYNASAFPIRVGRDVVCAVQIVADYQWSLRGLEGEALATEKTACHTRGAERLKDLCFANGGIYIKLGQHLAMLDYLLPEEYVVTMRRHMLDTCPVSSFSSVAATIEEDLGAPISVLFSEFDKEPVASASLAQVYRARDAATGIPVAVKVQHRGLAETSALDLMSTAALLKLVKLATGMDFMWLTAEAQTNLPKELNFKNEAINAERCAGNLASHASSMKGRVAVPRIDHSKTSTRVCTMEWIEGVKVTDLAGLAAMGVPPAGLARLISQCFNEMIFKFGDLHADPHAANMLVRAVPAGAGPGAPANGLRWQLVLLDHGLYRRLTDEFRLEYASLWRSLIFGDVKGIERSAHAMGAGDAVPLFAGMLTRKPWREVSRGAAGAERLALKGTTEEREEIQRYGAQYAGEIGDLLGRVPRELLLLLKTNDNLRAVDLELGARVSTYLITARACCAALAAQRAAEVPGWRSWAASAVEGVRLETRLAALRAVAWVAMMRAALWGGGDEGAVGEPVDEVWTTTRPATA